VGKNCSDVIAGWSSTRWIADQIIFKDVRRVKDQEHPLREKREKISKEKENPSQAGFQGEIRIQASPRWGDLLVIASWARPGGLLRQICDREIDQISVHTERGKEIGI
jgi:hypothetical protein